ncbi:lysin [Lactobacillus xujianguonis]|uniref:Lysin n=1 Tax=Lactobacillus xujianguonis TaxID=2495899 RepID=A0A437SUC5_9LACO|nr:GH25 family lysozyme [Lactobacillus xujianguonis]RVU70417.1 lysin [Lactobacillus xujianguonis]
MPKIAGVDVSAYQPSSLTKYHNSGAKYVIIKATEGTWYTSPVASAQLKSAHQNHMYVHAYHYANFGSSVSRAKAEAKYFVKFAKKIGISKKRWLWCDWEQQGNNVNDGKNASTKAIIAFMSEVKSAGYHAGLYSGASLLRNNINLSAIVKKFGDCVWVASYATMGRIDNPNFGYFPSMDGVAIWQFTDNWRGLNVDGNVMLIDLHESKASVKPSVKAETKKATQTSSEHKISGTAYAPLIHNDPKWKIRLRDGDGHWTSQYIPTNSKWKVFAEKTIKGEKCYKLGTDKQWASAKYLKLL